MFHGVYLLLIAFIAVLYDPHSGRFGFNPNAKSALIAGGIFAFLSFLWAFFDSRGAIKIPVIGGLISTGLLCIVFLFRAVPSPPGLIISTVTRSNGSPLPQSLS